MKTAVAVIVFVALALRIGFALTMKQEFYFGDSKRYSEVARNLLDGRGFVQDSAWDFMQFPDENPGPYVAASARVTRHFWPAAISSRARASCSYASCTH